MTDQVPPASDELIDKLDAEYAATTPGEWEVKHSIGESSPRAAWVLFNPPLGSGKAFGTHNMATDDQDATWIADAHNEWPAVRERLQMIESECDLLVERLRVAEAGWEKAHDEDGRIKGLPLIQQKWLSEKLTAMEAALAERDARIKSLEAAAVQRTKVDNSRRPSRNPW